MHNDEEFDQEKTLTLTKNELIFLSDSVTLTLEHFNENGRVHMPARQLMPSAKVPVPIELIHTIGMGLLIASDPKNNTQTAEVSFAIADLYLLRECCQPFSKINDEYVGYNLLKKVYSAILETTMSERDFINKLTAGIDFTSQIEFNELTQQRIEELKRNDSENKST
tara:strand:- start:364 stop:864 length:501 start_codon:yes stop_codon:yes gene_type:complete